MFSVSASAGLCVSARVFLWRGGWAVPRAFWKVEYACLHINRHIYIYIYIYMDGPIKP